jgi:hypothetical protein
LSDGEAPAKGQVVTLRGAAPPVPTEPDQEVVGKLEELLQLAKDSQLTGLVYGLVFANQDITTGWAGKADSHTMIAAATIVQHRVLAFEVED